MAILYLLLSFLSGSKVKILPNVVLFNSIMLITILSPEGLILTTIGPLVITKGAIYSGIGRSSLLIGLLYLSKNISMSNIKFSGKLGLIIRDTFHYFNQLTSGDRVKFSNFLIQIDEKLLNLKPYSLGENNSTIIPKLNFSYITFIITLILFLLDKFPYTF